MTSADTGDRLRFLQRDIYDLRYAGDGYENRSSVRVLRAEMAALRGAVERALRSNPGIDTVSLADFGFGTGRVVIEFVDDYAARYGTRSKNLRVIAYDVSSVGLQRAAENLTEEYGFSSFKELDWQPDSSAGYIAGSLSRDDGDVSLTIVFVHGSEYDPADAVEHLLRQANQGERSLVTTSWYSGLGHVVGHENRAALFHHLGELTRPSGELVIAVAATGDVVDLQIEWAERLKADQVEGLPIETDGDVVYETELGQLNFWHVFGTDLNEHLEAITDDNQSWWIEAIRFPDEEFESRDDEESNYAKVKELNERKNGELWQPEDFQKCHTVAAFRSPKASRDDG